jgi:hypothetical protein
MTFSIRTLSIKGLFVTLCINVVCVTLFLTSPEKYAFYSYDARLNVSFEMRRIATFVMQEIKRSISK